MGLDTSHDCWHGDLHQGTAPRRQPPPARGVSLMTSPLSAAPDVLLQMAKDLFSDAGKPDRHWSIKATVLGRITDESRHPGYADAESWAKAELDLASGEYRLAMKLWRLILKTRDAGVTVETWRSLSKGKALLVAEALDAGGHPNVWVNKALAAGRGDTFQHELDRYLDRQVWTTLKVRMPVEVRDLVHEACQRALPYVLTDPKTDVGQWQEPANLFRCLELVCGKFVRDTPVMMVEEESL